MTDHERARHIASAIRAYADSGVPPALSGDELNNLSRAYLELVDRVKEAERIVDGFRAGTENVSDCEIQDMTDTYRTKYPEAIK